MGISSNTLLDSAAKFIFEWGLGRNRAHQRCTEIGTHAGVQSLQLHVIIAVFFCNCIGNLVLCFFLQQKDSFLLILSHRVQASADGLKNTLPRLLPSNVEVFTRFVSELLQLVVLPLFGLQTVLVILFLVASVNFIDGFLELECAKFPV